jgi:hypothetical protein
MHNLWSVSSWSLRLQSWIRFKFFQSPKQTHLPSVCIADGFLPRFRGHARRHGDFLDAFGGLVAGFELVEDFLGAVDDVFGEAELTTCGAWLSRSGLFCR